MGIVIIFLILRLLNIFRKTLTWDLRAIIFIIILTKLIFFRNHFLNLLILLEVFIVLGYVLIVSEISLVSSSTISLFLFIVVIVLGACLGISLLVIITRTLNKKLELASLRF